MSCEAFLHRVMQLCKSNIKPIIMNLRNIVAITSFVAALAGIAGFPVGLAQLQVGIAQLQVSLPKPVDPTPSTSPSPTTSPSPVQLPDPSPTPTSSPTPTPPPLPISLMSLPEQALNESDRLLHERKCQQYLETFSNARRSREAEDILRYCQHEYISIKVCNQQLLDSSPTRAKVWQKLVVVDSSTSQRRTTIDKKTYTLVFEDSAWRVHTQEFDKISPVSDDADCSTL